MPSYLYPCTIYEYVTLSLAVAEWQPLLFAVPAPYRKSLRQNITNLFVGTPQITPTKCRKSLQQNSANLLNETPQNY